MASEYIITLADIAQIPGLFKNGFLQGRAEPRIAFVGRSNVGKSSLINALLEERIARVSATPGKTKAIHFFLWGTHKKIVADLPGYGFARVAKDEQKTWARLMDSYFHADSRLEVVMILFDSRHGPTDQDLEALEFFASKGTPIQIVLTKVDQLKNQSERAKRKKEILQALAPYEIGEEDLFWVSVKDRNTLHQLRGMLK
jgi:GTP-binding protein